MAHDTAVTQGRARTYPATGRRGDGGDDGGGHFPAAGSRPGPRDAGPGGADEHRGTPRDAAAPAAVDPPARLRERAALPAGLRRRRRPPRRLPGAGRPREVPDDRQERPAGELPVRHVRRPAGPDPAGARLLRHDRAADRRRLHRGRSGHLGHGRGAVHPGRGRAARRRGAHRLRVRPVHRRARRALRRGEARLHGHPDLRGHDPASGAADQRLPAPRDHGDAVLHARRHRRAGAAGHRPADDVAGDRHLRRRTVDRPDAPGDRGPARHRRRRHLRPVRGHGARRRPGVRRDQGRPAHLGGPLLPGDRRPVHRRRAAGRRTGRAAVHHPDQGGHAGHPVPHPRPDPAAAGHRAARDAPDGEGHRPHRRHDHPARGEPVPDAGRGDRPADGGPVAALPAGAHHPRPARPPHRRGRGPAGLPG